MRGRVGHIQVDSIDFPVSEMHRAHRKWRLKRKWRRERRSSGAGAVQQHIVSSARLVQQEPAAAAVLPAKPPPEQLPRGMKKTAAQVLLSQHPPGQPARAGEVGGSRRVGAHSETKCIQIQTICSSSSSAAVAFHSSSRCSSCAAPAGSAGPAKSGGCQATSFHACFFFFL